MQLAELARKTTGDLVSRSSPFQNHDSFLANIDQIRASARDWFDSNPNGVGRLLDFATLWSPNVSLLDPEDVTSIQNLLLLKLTEMLFEKFHENREDRE